MVLFWIEELRPIKEVMGCRVPPLYFRYARATGQSSVCCFYHRSAGQCRTAGGPDTPPAPAKASQEAGVTANVVWYAVKRCAGRAGVGKLQSAKDTSIA